MLLAQVPRLFAPNERAARHFLEFFAANIRNTLSSASGGGIVTFQTGTYQVSALGNYDIFTVSSKQTLVFPAGCTIHQSAAPTGGQCGILGHISLEDGVMVATRGGVSKSLKKGAYRGSPAIPITEYNRQEVYIRRLEQYAKRLEALEKQLKEKDDQAKS